MKLGKTIAGEREKVITESERLIQRDIDRKHKNMRIAILVAVIVLAMVAGYVAIVHFLNDRKTPDAVVESKIIYEPTVDIIDEANAATDSKYITDSIRQYVGKIERDLKDLGKTVSRVVIPSGKMRELDVYLEGRNEYYKCSLDRGTAESAEDVVRMVGYLEKNNIEATYVDLRIEKRAYYK